MSGSWRIFWDILTQQTDPITKMSAPQSLTKVRRFLGMLNYFGKFISNIANFKYYCTTRSTFEKYVVFSTLQKPQKNSMNFDCIIEIKNKYKLLRIKSTTRTKSWLIGNTKVTSNRIFIPCLKWIREMYTQIEKESHYIAFVMEPFCEYSYGRKCTIINDRQRLRLIFTFHPECKIFSLDCRSMTSSSSMPPIKQC